VIPLHFGDSKEPLFGVLSEPRPGAERGHGVVMCPPIAQEHVRAHWAFRQVAAALARAGFHVLRFDWFGVGDSAGAMANATVDRWVVDVETAAQELKDAAGIRKVSLIGLRLGAALAALAAPRVKPGVVVLWDPVLDGRRYLEDLRALQTKVIADDRRFWFRWPLTVRSTLGKLRPDLAQERRPSAEEMVGFDFPSGLRRGIDALDMQAFTKMKRARVVLLDSEGEPGSAALIPTLEGAGVRVERRVTQARGRWMDPRQIEELLLPGDALQSITEALEGGIS
jgi:alpha/beta superfamily hydrolase